MFSLKVLIFAPCLLSLFASCGKKVESTDTSNEGTDESAVIILPGDSGVKKFTVNYSKTESNNNVVSLVMKGSAWARVPDAPKVISGQAVVAVTRIRFNVVENSASFGEDEVYCEYRSIRRTVGSPDQDINEQYDHYFKGCFEDVDGDGQSDSLNFIPGDEIGILQGRAVEVRVTPDSSSESLVVESEIEVEYF